jgi:ERCC4-related helicase
MDLSAEYSPPSIQETDPPIRLRSYQQEMLEWSLKQNVIVVMDTGSGKTHVAIKRIAEQLKYRLEANGAFQEKTVWFMCPSVALCMQQYEVLAKHLPAYLVKTLLGSDGVDKWTTQELWDGFLTNVKVVVCTPKVLEDALTHGFVKIFNILLMVFDEAHRCIGDSPMNTIMRNFYHPAKLQKKVIPHILGLTASPIMSAKSSSLETIEANLDAKAVTPKVHRSELQEYVHPPQILCVDFQHLGDDTEWCAPLYHALKHTLDSYDLSSDPWIKHLLDIGDSTSQAQLDKQILVPNTWCYKQLKTLRQRASHLKEQLGSAATEWYINTCIQKCVQSEQYQPVVLLDVSQQERQHLRKILLDVQRSNDGDSNTVRRPFQVSDKTQELIKLLYDNRTRNARGVIFVEQRATVSALAYLLRNNESLNSSWTVGSFVGTSSFAGRKTALADLTELKEQTQDLEDFRCGAKNLIISTSVLEEGIDVRISWVQCLVRHSLIMPNNFPGQRM